MENKIYSKGLDDGFLIALKNLKKNIDNRMTIEMVIELIDMQISKHEWKTNG